MNHEEIKGLIETIAASGVAEVEIESKDFKLKVRSKARVKHTQGEQFLMTQAPVAAHSPSPVIQTQLPPMPHSETAKPVESTDNLIYIKSPMVGTFYLKPSPEKPNFLNAGDQVSPGQVVCIVEAMKLFNEIESEISGKVVKVLVENATPVEFDQPLFAVEP